MRASWMICVGLALASAVGCAGDNRDSLINNVGNQISEVATSVGVIKSKLEEFVKKKEGDSKDDEAAKKELDDAVGEAEKLKKAAKELQKLSTKVANAPAPTDDEKKEFLKKHLARINSTRDELLLSHREMKAALAKASEKYEEPLRPLLKALSESEAEFAAIVRKR